jgi:hypothetical protein
MLSNFNRRHVGLQLRQARPTVPGVSAVLSSPSSRDDLTGLLPFNVSVAISDEDWVLFSETKPPLGVAGQFDLEPATLILPPHSSQNAAPTSAMSQDGVTGADCLNGFHPFAGHNLLTS